MEINNMRNIYVGRNNHNLGKNGGHMLSSLGDRLIAEVKQWACEYVRETKYLQFTKFLKFDNFNSKTYFSFAPIDLCTVSI